MTPSRTTIFATLCALALTAHAQGGATRSDIQAQLAQARDSGAIEVVGDSGLLLRERFPQRFQESTGSPGLTRDAVRLALQAAIRDGDVAQGDLGRTVRETARLAEAPVGSKTRAQVRDELAQAVRDGDVEEIGEGGRLLRDTSPRRYRDGSGSGASRAYAMEAGS